MCFVGKNLFREIKMNTLLEWLWKQYHCYDISVHFITFISSDHFLSFPCILNIKKNISMAVVSQMYHFPTFHIDTLLCKDIHQQFIKIKIKRIREVRRCVQVTMEKFIAIVDI